MARTRSWAELREQQLPSFQRGTQGVGYARGMGAAVEDRIAVLRVAALARNPRRCPDDALDVVGQAYNLPRFPNEPNGDLTSGYRGRLCKAWETWDKAGSADAIIESLKAYGFVDVEVFATCPQYREDGTVVPAWTSPTGNYAHFWVVLGPDLGTITTPTVQTWGDFLWGEESWGSTMAQSLVKAIKGQIRKWKAVHALPHRVVIIVEEGFLWGPSLWGESTWGAGQAFQIKVF